MRERRSFKSHPALPDDAVSLLRRAFIEASMSDFAWRAIRFAGVKVLTKLKHTHAVHATLRLFSSNDEHFI